MRATVILAIALVLGSCHSTGGVSSGAIIEHQRRVIELENTNRQFAERLARYDNLVNDTISRLEAVRGRAGSIKGAADRIEYLFGEYERIVYEIINQMRAAGESK